jgi:AcrR family transcriptional regulator
MVVLSKGESTRRLILDHGLATASLVGLDGLSLGEMARQVGMSKSGLFAHFESKENLQLQVLETAVTRFVDSVVAPALRRPRGEPRVRALFQNWLAWSVSDWMPGGCVFIATANELDDRPGLLRDRLVASQRDWLSALAAAAHIAVEEGHFRPDLDTEQFAYEMYSIALACHHFHRLLRDPTAFERAASAFDRLVNDSRSRRIPQQPDHS